MTGPEPGSVVWHHLVTTDVAASAEFYGLLFGWKFTNWAPGGRQVWIDGIQSAGVVPAEDGASYWLPFVWVTGLDATLERVQDAGGRVLDPADTVAGSLRSAEIADPDGARLALVEPEAEFPWPPGGINLTAPVAWLELLTTDVEAAARFYVEAFGWTAAELDDPAYRALATAEQGVIGGIAESPPELPEPLWLMCVSVWDSALDETIERAELLEAELLVEIDRIDQPSTIFRDPTGAIFGLV